MTTPGFEHAYDQEAVTQLARTKARGNGRNNQGRITTRHKGGGARKFYRLVNFKLASGTTATIEHIEYDPNRSARIARIKESNGTYHYILAAANMKVGQTVAAAKK